MAHAVIVWGAQITSVRIVLAVVLQFAIVAYFIWCTRLFGR